MGTALCLTYANVKRDTLALGEWGFVMLPQPNSTSTLAGDVMIMGRTPQDTSCVCCGANKVTIGRQIQPANSLKIYLAHLTL